VENDQEESMQLTQKHVDYWNKNLVVTTILMIIWFVITYVIGYYAIQLNEITVFGWPIPFYMGAQGSLALYVVIIGYYAWYMNKLDKEYGVHEGEEE
jgi:putative solute:sodium symporter small subunit